MRRFILTLMLTIATVSGQQRPSSPNTAETAPKPELFRDPSRKVKNAKGELVTADLRPLFSWFQTKRGPRPMNVWNRFILTTVQNTPDGVVVSNSLDGKVFFLRNYPYKVPLNSVIHVFAIDDGYHTYKDASGAEKTVHAYDYGTTPSASGERKPAAAKPSSSAGKPTNAPPESAGK